MDGTTEPRETVTRGQRSVQRTNTTLSDGTRLAVELTGQLATTQRAEAALAAARLAVDPPKPRASQISNEGYCGIVGRSPRMTELFKMLERIRGSEATVLITGDNGTGKELVARAIHDESPRAKHRFVATNCSAFNDNLLESELFGHKRGAFTGAVSEKPGLFEIAHSGTFFLDEVGDMSPALQVKLLRVLQDGTFLPVGGTEHRTVNVRIIAATNRDLPTMVSRGTFREDLFYRLHVVVLKLPALRERRSDIPMLVRHFMGRLAQRDGRSKELSDEAESRLMSHEWPGNVRELENEIERVWVLSGDEAVIGSQHLTPSLGRGGAHTEDFFDEPDPSVVAMRTLPDAVEALERRMIRDGLRRAGGNKTRAAEELGVSRRNLIRKVHAYGLEPMPRGAPGPGSDQDLP